MDSKVSLLNIFGQSIKQVAKKACEDKGVPFNEEPIKQTVFPEGFVMPEPKVEEAK